MKIELSSKNFVRLTVNSARDFILDTNSNNIVLKRDDNYNIDTIVIDDIYKLKVGFTYEVDGISYKLRYIKKINNSFYCYQERPTKTSQFIIPVLGKTYEFYDFNKSFFNGYMSEDLKSIYLLYRFSNTETFIEMEGRLTKHPYFKQILDPSPEWVVIVFNIPQDYLKDVENIMLGSYDKLSPVMKAKIITFHSFTSESKVYKALYNSETLRQEMSEELGYSIPKEINLISKPIEKDEIWTYQSISKKVGILN